MSQEVRLQVEDARQGDVGKGLARIDQRTMEKLGISAGDAIEIVGKRATSAIACPALIEDQNRDVIRIDSFTRKNAGVAINGYVFTRPAKVKAALSITLAPVDMRLNVDENFTNFTKNRLMDRSLVEGSTTLLTLLGHSIPFTITETDPKGIVKVTAETRLTILNEPAQEVERLSHTAYEDIGGLHEETRKIREIIELPTRHPEIYQRLGVNPQMGILLYGPNGCGKTLLAKAIANESEANFFSINAPEITGKFYGESEARLRETFQEARKNAPSIIFIDHIDAIAKPRRIDSDGLENRVVDELLALMNGFESRGKVIVIAATDRIDLIDPALRRPGRFDIEIEIGLPDKQARYEILQIHTWMMPLAGDVDLEKLADMTDCYTGADLAALCQEAGMSALRHHLQSINLQKEQVPPSVLQRIEVRMQDFLDYFSKSKPAAKH